MGRESLLPRTIFTFQVGSDLSTIENAAAEASVAAFLSMTSLPAGLPLVVLLDETLLPEEEAYLCTADWREVKDAIATLKVRGAPAIGIAGACAMMLRAYEFCIALDDGRVAHDGSFDRVHALSAEEADPELFRAALTQCARMLDATRPTAVALKRALDTSMAIVDEGHRCEATPLAMAEQLHGMVLERIADDERTNRAIGRAGAALLGPASTILTHCNAGSLATAFYGTALGVVYAAADEGKVARVFADETRPVCQGSRLTVWELAKAGIPTTLICDDMAAYVMAQGTIDAVIVGADRIAANGDVANKIGTLSVAICARHFGIPFYVAAPFETIDFSLADGTSIPIEERAPEEVCARPIAGVDIHNPAFDVTPASLVSGIITERGVLSPHGLEATMR